MARLPKVQLRAIPVFPSSVTGEIGVAVTKANGTFTASLDVSSFQKNGVPVELVSTTYALTWGNPTTDNAGGTWQLVPYSTIQSASSDVTALEAVTSGIIAKTSTATYAGRTITGTSNEVSVSNGTGISGNPTVSLPVALTLTGKTLTGGTFVGPSISGGTVGGLQGLSILSTGSIFNTVFATNEATTAQRVLNFVLGDANRTLQLGGNLATANALTTVGNFPSTFTMTGSTTVTFPTTGTLATLSGAETLSNKTLVAPALGTPVSGIATNLTGTAAGLTAGSVTTNANLTGDVTSVGNATTLTNAPVIAKVLTGYVSGAGTISAADSILQAIQKLNGNDALKASLASPTLTGTPAAPTAAVDTNTTQIATTAMVLAQAASATPLIDGAATVGTSTRFARGDHIHPTDTTRAPVASPVFTTSATAPVFKPTNTVASGLPHVDTSALAGVVVAASAHAKILAGSAYGLIFISETATAAMAGVYLCYGAGSVVFVGGDSRFIAPTVAPGAGQSSVAFDGTDYSVYNGTGSSRTFRTTVVQNA